MLRLGEADSPKVESQVEQWELELEICEHRPSWGREGVCKHVSVYGPMCAPLSVHVCVCAYLSTCVCIWGRVESPEAGSEREGCPDQGAGPRGLSSDGAQTVPESHSRTPRVPLGHFVSDFHILLLQVLLMDGFHESYLGRSTSIMELQVHAKFHF